MVFASTRQLYGRAASLPADEGHAVAPPDVHAIHKETAEHLVRHSAEQRGVSFSVLRLTNTYGPGQPTAGPAAGLTGRFLSYALAGREITILGDPGLLRDFNYVDDVVDGFLRAGEPGAPAGTWNLGTAPVRLREIGDFHSDWSAIRRDLGWEPAWTLESGLAETVRAMRSEAA